MTAGAPPIRLLACEAAVRPARTRMPFRYGIACMTAAPILHVRVEIECEGRHSQGLAADCLPPRWFDKDPEKTFRRNVEDQIAAYRIAREVWLETAARPRALYAHWLEALPRTLERCAERGLNALTASFGSSFLERAAIDALGRSLDLSFFTLLRKDLLGLRTSDFVPEAPLERIRVRHTVGLGDPITAGDIPPEERLDDGLPQALEEAIAAYGLRSFKVKVSGDHDRDLERLTRIAGLLERVRGGAYEISLDGNEQYSDLEDLMYLLDALRRRPEGDAFFHRILYIEQPLRREIALEPRAAESVRRLGALRPVTIDESDDRPESFERAIALGYRGTSHKNCKGIFKSLLNLKRARERNAEAGLELYFLTAEDLANVPVVPLQEDLCSVAALGIEHAERNGHHYFRGLDHLPRREAESALDAHPDLYRTEGGSVFLRIEDGHLAVGSLVRCPGYGYAAAIAFEERTPLDAWSFDLE